MPSIFKSSSRKDKPHPTGKSFSVPSRERANGPKSPKDHLAASSPRVVSFTEFGGLKHAPTAAHQTPPTPFDNPSSPYDADGPPILPPKYVFAPTRLPTITSVNSIDSFAYSQDEVTRSRHYGFLGGVGAKITLGLDEVGRVVKVVGKELERRALTTPMLFSNQALETSPVRVRGLIQSYLDCVRSSSASRRDTWTRDLQFAREHELAWLLRWALSRIVRMKEGTKEVCHGVLEWDVYEEWRGRERAANYPHNAFPYLSAIVPAEVYHLVISPLLSLLSRFAAHSHLSGLTPHALSSLFAPFFFDIPTDSPCLVAHAAFVRAASATEHLLLSYIRWTGQGEGLGVTNLPGRLREWVSGYPAMLASDADLARATPRRGARTIRCERASRLVRAYSKDLIASAELWAGDFDSWPVWERVILMTKRGEAGRPKFSAAWKRRMAVKDNLPLPSNATTSDGEITYGQARKPTLVSRREEKRANGGSEDGQEVLWGSLAGKEWSMFEEGGFDSPDLTLTPGKEDMKERLRFDLNESAKQSVNDRRKTMEWSDFAAPSGGFTRTDPVLDVSLSFASPLASSINEWPKEREDLHRRLHKAQKDATPFHYDTKPKVGSEVVDAAARADGNGRVFVEEAFVDWWADWGVGGGWIDKDELTFREASWALIEYKARPSRPVDNSHDPSGDPRVSDLYFLFEEKVPIEYQLAIANPQEKRTFTTLFNSRKKRNANNNVGNAIASGTPTKGRGSASGWEDSDFDRMLLHRDKTKKITATGRNDQQASVWHMAQEPVSAGPTKATRTMSNGSAKAGGAGGAGGAGPIVEGKASFFSKNKERVVRRVKTDEGHRERVKAQRDAQKEHAVDFELASASGVSSPDTSPRDRNAKKGEEKWMDILIANGAKRMDRQDAEPPRERAPRQGLSSGNASGLPISPHPPARHPSPTPPRSTPHHVQPTPVGQRTDPYAQYNDPAPLSNLGMTHSPETSGSDAEVEAVTPRAGAGGGGADIVRWGSGRRKPVPRIESTMEELDDGGHEYRYPGNEREQRDAREGPIPPLKDRPSSGELLAPSPRRQRDTIRDIVNGYRDSTGTEGTVGTVNSIETSGTRGTAGTTRTPRKSGEVVTDGEGEVDESELSFAEEGAYASRFANKDGERGGERDHAALGLGPRIGGDGMEGAAGSAYKLPRKDEVARMRAGGSFEMGERGDGRVNESLAHGGERGEHVMERDDRDDRDGEDDSEDRDGEDDRVDTDEETSERRDSILEPPKMSGPVFDLTPGREPSPARYRHGEPLHFVGEESEEEEY